MKIRNNLLLIKSHYFFFFAALGPILPFISVIGKQLGISEIVMGIVYAPLPLMYFFGKTFYGFIIDYFVQLRNLIFTGTIGAMGIFFVLIYFVPSIPLTLTNIKTKSLQNTTCSSTFFCDYYNNNNTNRSIYEACNVSCNNGKNETNTEFKLISQYCQRENNNSECYFSNSNCSIDCTHLDSHIPTNILLRTTKFWTFVFLISLGLTTFNIINSASDTICFHVLGEGNEMKYGNQRLWGTIGYGIAASLAGYLIDKLSKDTIQKDNSPSFVLLMVFIFVDVLICTKIKFAETQKPKHVLKEAFKILKRFEVIVFMIFILILGILDGFVVYYLFWFLEIKAEEWGGYENIRLLEGITVLVQSLGELVIFPLLGKIIPKFGFEYSLMLCLMCYSVRLYGISVIINPWWTLPVEFVCHGIGYGSAYFICVTYTSLISSHQIQGTMLGIISGIFDGCGYAIGSVIGGAINSHFGMKTAFKIFSITSLITLFVYYLVYVSGRTRPKQEIVTTAQECLFKTVDQEVPIL